MKEQTADFRETALAAAVSAGVGAGAAVTAVLISAAFSLLADDPAGLFAPLGLASLYLGAAAGGFFAVRRTGAFHAALLTGAVLLCAVFTGGLFFRSPLAYPAPVFILLLALIPSASALGAFLGRKKKKKRPSVRRRSSFRRKLR